MMPLIQSVRDIDAEQHVLMTRAYGMIEVSRGKFDRVQLKPWPKLGSIVEARWVSYWKNTRRPHDGCRLFYNQPLQHRSFLALTYLESSLNTSLETVFTALRVLDRIAYIKRSDAILAEISNERISDKLLRRLGWERHREQSRQRNWIKRFYGTYPVWATGKQDTTVVSA
jgi:hypothetical protein